MEIREKRAQQATLEVERRLDDALGALKHERNEAARERQLRTDADEAAEELNVRTSRPGLTVRFPLW